MAKPVPVKDIGVPVPSDTSKVASVVCYYGPSGFVPSYSQSARVVFAVSSLKTTSVGSPAVSYYDVPIGAQLPASLPDGSYDFVFTFADKADATAAESDFSPPVTEALDRTVPPQPGQPVVLT